MHKVECAAASALPVPQDEIGDLSRSLSTMVRRLSEYNDYLESMGGRLAHEIRTPIAVVRSSLDNLSLQPLPEDAKRYMDRAREGLARLSRIVASMTEATRLEQTLQQADHEKFDLTEVVSGCVSGYRLAYAHCAFELTVPSEPVTISGAPELIAQMLDKLVANAVDFARAGTPVAIRLEVRPVRGLVEREQRRTGAAGKHARPPVRFDGIDPARRFRKRSPPRDGTLHRSHDRAVSRRRDAGAQQCGWNGSRDHSRDAGRPAAVTTPIRQAI